MKKTTQFVFATYQVELKNQEKFVDLLKNCEKVMRQENLITNQAIFRMNSNENQEFIIEIFEWQDENSFENAQSLESVLNFWGQYEKLWIKGGFGIAEIPEAKIPWAQLKSIS